MRRNAHLFYLVIILPRPIVAVRSRTGNVDLYGLFFLALQQFVAFAATRCEERQQGRLPSLVSKSNALYSHSLSLCLHVLFMFKCVFTNQTHFSTMFKRLYGMFDKIDEKRARQKMSLTHRPTNIEPHHPPAKAQATPAATLATT